MTEGLTTTGMVVDTTDQTLTKIEQDELAAIDAALDTSPEEPLGQLNGVYASDRSLVAQLLQAIYSAIDANNAEGQQLDVLCALSGTVRKGPTSTTVKASLTISGSPTITPAVLDKNGNVVTPGNILAQIAGHPEFVFTNTALPVTPAQFAAGLRVFVCLQTGPIACNAGTLTVLSPPVTGITAITNTADGALGADIETDPALRIRRLIELIPADGGTFQSLLASVLAVKGTGPGLQGVISAQLLDNDTDVTDGNGVPPHAFEAVIWDGASPQAANDDIAQAIWNAKPAGVRSYDGGSGFSGTAIDGAGASHTVGFNRATQDVLYIAISVKIDSTRFPTTGDAQIAAALVAEGNALKPGGEVDLNELASVCLERNGGVAGVRTFTLIKCDTNPSPVNTTDIATLATHIARFDVARVAVTHV